MEVLIERVKDLALVYRRLATAMATATATPGVDSGGNKTQAFLQAFKQIATTSRWAGARCWATQHDWLLLLDTVSLRAVLLNPGSGTTVDVPRLAEDLPANCRCLLSEEKATSHGCVLLVVDIDRPVFRYCRVDPQPHRQQQQHRWYTHEYSFDEKRLGFQVRAIGASHGYFFFPVSPTELMSMELLCYDFSPAPEPRFTGFEHDELPPLDPGRLTWEETPRHLVGSGGELLMVVQSYPRCDGTYGHQEVYRMEFNRRRWARVPRFGRRVLLLGPPRFAFAASLPASELGVVEDNRVCIVGDGEEKPMYILDLTTCSGKLLPVPTGHDDPTLSRMRMLSPPTPAALSRGDDLQARSMTARTSFRPGGH